MTVSEAAGIAARSIITFSMIGFAITGFNITREINGRAKSFTAIKG